MADSPSIGHEFSNGTDEFARAAAKLCRDRLGREVLGCARAGWPGSPAVRVIMEDAPVIVTRRSHPDRTRFEADVVTELAEAGAPVPRILGFDGEFLIQQDLGPTTLIDAFARPGETVWIDRLDQALASLRLIHAAGRETSLCRRMPRIGVNTDWIDNLISAPTRIGRRLGSPAPRLDAPRLVDLLLSPNQAFIKWDTRPANAALCDTGAVAWFDWQNCGRRDPLDDIAWLMGDERLPDQPETEASLILRHLDRLAGPDYRGDPVKYLMAFGALHMCVRILVLLNARESSQWRQTAFGWPEDRSDGLRDALPRTCRRAARWAANSLLTEPLAAWLFALPDLIEASRSGFAAAANYPENATIH
jgi:Phosphotransferase enzyme family